MTARFCARCGRPAVECDGACLGPSDTERYCPECGKRMAVLVTPTRAEARCREHGPLHSHE